MCRGINIYLSSTFLFLSTLYISLSWDKAGEQLRMSSSCSSQKAHCWYHMPVLRFLRSNKRQFSVAHSSLRRCSCANAWISNPPRTLCFFGYTTVHSGGSKTNRRKITGFFCFPKRYAIGPTCLFSAFCAPMKDIFSWHVVFSAGARVSGYKYPPLFDLCVSFNTRTPRRWIKTTLNNVYLLDFSKSLRSRVMSSSSALYILSNQNVRITLYVPASLAWRRELGIQNAIFLLI